MGPNISSSISGMFFSYSVTEATKPYVWSYCVVPHWQSHLTSFAEKEKQIRYRWKYYISELFCVNIQKFRTVNSCYKGHLLSFYFSLFFSWAFSCAGSRARIRYVHETSVLTSECSFPWYNVNIRNKKIHLPTSIDTHTFFLIFPFIWQKIELAQLKTFSNP